MHIDKIGKSGYFTLTLDTELQFPEKYWRPFLDELKATVRPHDRDYDQATQTWTIREAHYQAVVELRRKHFEKDQISLF